MHYKNGREAKNGDKVLFLNEYQASIGVLYDAQAGNDFCNGNLAPISAICCPNLKDCLHLDDVKAMLADQPESFGVKGEPGQFDVATLYADITGGIAAIRASDWWKAFGYFADAAKMISGLQIPPRPLMLSAVECPYSDLETCCNYLEQQAAALKSMKADPSGAAPWGQLVVLLPALLDVLKLIFGK